MLFKLLLPVVLSSFAKLPPTDLCDLLHFCNFVNTNIYFNFLKVLTLCQQVIFMFCSLLQLSFSWQLAFLYPFFPLQVLIIYSLCGFLLNYSHFGSHFLMSATFSFNFFPKFSCSFRLYVPKNASCVSVEFLTHTRV